MPDSRPSGEPQPRARRRVHWLGCSLGGLGCLVIVVALLLTIGAIPAGQWWCEWRNSGEYERHRDRYEQIVLNIAAMRLGRNTSTYFSISPGKDPSTLKVIDLEQDPYSLRRENETTVVVAKVTPGGRLTVRICTYSMGHAGVFGLYYSSGTPGAGEVENSFGAGGRVAPVAPRWWRVSDYSQ